MAIVHFTVAEVRAMLDLVTPVYQEQYDALAAEHVKEVALYKERRAAEEKERDERPARREAKLRANARELFEKQEAWRDAHPIRSFFGGKWKTEEEFYEDLKRTTIWADAYDYHWGLLMWRYPKCPEHSRLTYCLDLAKKIEGYEDDRVLGLQPGEAEILKANENSAQLGSAT